MVHFSSATWIGGLYSYIFKNGTFPIPPASTWMVLLDDDRVPIVGAEVEIPGITGWDLVISGEGCGKVFTGGQNGATGVENAFDIDLTNGTGNTWVYKYISIYDAAPGGGGVEILRGTLESAQSLPDGQALSISPGDLRYLSEYLVY